jgi:hypothetical protein
LAERNDGALEPSKRRNAREDKVMSIIHFLSRLPAPSVPPPTLPSGTVTLFADDNWGSERATLRTADYPESVRHLFDGTPMQDQATFIAFNLPVGTVMTLMDGVVPPNVRFCGRCVDLVGTGKTESVNLMSINLNECLSGFSWRKVDLGLGATELFADDNFNGDRTTIFLRQWPSSTVRAED